MPNRKELTAMPKAQVVCVDLPGMEEQNNALSAFMMDESDRPMTRVVLLRMIREKPVTNVMPSCCMIPIPTKEAVEGNGGRRIRR